MKTKINLLCLLAGLLLMACSSDDEKAATVDFSGNNRGTFVDSRDNTTYHYITIGNLDWMLENGRYDTGDDATRVLYPVLPDKPADVETTNQATIEKYGYLYSYEGAKQAAPEGWRLATDDDWKSLEQQVGMKAAEADKVEWRGVNQASLLREPKVLNLLLGGFYNEVSTSFASQAYFLEARGYYWTGTAATDGLAYFRRIDYNNERVYRNTSDVTNKMSARFVRNHTEAL